MKPQYLRNEIVAFDYDNQPKETLDHCQHCVCPPMIHNFARRDRYGFKVGVSECGGCGLNWLSPRMTKEAYARFYETAYRPLVSAFHGREINAQTIQPEQVGYAERLAKFLEPWCDQMRNGKVLDIGGSTGIVARFLADCFFLFPHVLDPSLDELNAAEMTGGGPLELIPGMIEDFDANGRTWDLVTMCQTADHLLDLMGSLKKIKSLLSEGGLFWSDIVDFDVTREVKIDHPFNLTEKTYRQFLLKAGFTLLQINYAPDGKHIGFLCR